MYAYTYIYIYIWVYMHACDISMRTSRTNIQMFMSGRVFQDGGWGANV